MDFWVGVTTLGDLFTCGVFGLLPILGSLCRRRYSSVTLFRAFLPVVEVKEDPVAGTRSEDRGAPECVGDAVSVPLILGKVSALRH